MAAPTTEQHQVTDVVSLNNSAASSPQAHKRPAHNYERIQRSPVEGSEFRGARPHGFNAMPAVAYANNYTCGAFPVYRGNNHEEIERRYLACSERVPECAASSSAKPQLDNSHWGSRNVWWQ